MRYIPLIHQNTKAVWETPFQDVFMQAAVDTVEELSVTREMHGGGEEG
jgi:hypothetical protein